MVQLLETNDRNEGAVMSLVGGIEEGRFIQSEAQLVCKPGNGEPKWVGTRTIGVVVEDDKVLGVETDLLGTGRFLGDEHYDDCRKRDLAILLGPNGTRTRWTGSHDLGVLYNQQFFSLTRLVHYTSSQLQNRSNPQI